MIKIVIFVIKVKVKEKTRIPIFSVFPDFNQIAP